MRFVMVSVRIVLGLVDGNGCALLHPDRDVEEYDRRLKDRHADQFLDQVVLRDHRVKPDQKKYDVDTVIEPFAKQLSQESGICISEKHG